MLKISECSHVAHISGRMLRYYDERGLLKPAYVDSETGYRYYTLEQLPRFHRLQALKDLGFTEAAQTFTRFTPPALLVWGKDDPFFSPRLAIRLQQVFPDARLMRLSHARAFLQLD